ncbi:hypothetical protein AB8U03_15475 [Clostridium sp. Mt-5]|uniref:Defence against restriction A C-terminal domain-containing protein n=1 Tax=Clostridium moutaii TaxID=3240932 RepID=A0ABV4BS08_9CLOT
MYRYYSTERPVSLGTYPKIRGNMPINIENFKTKIYVHEINREAYGYLEYEHELTDKQIFGYELCTGRNRARYVLDKKNMAILDTKNNCWVCGVDTKRPDLFEDKIKELLDLANR